MQVIFCKPELTMKKLKDAECFFMECSRILNQYLLNVNYIEPGLTMQQAKYRDAEKDDILIFFTSETGEYGDEMLKLINRYHACQSRIWAVAMEANPECRRPPEPVSDRQSFDVSSRKENRNPLKDNMKAIVQIFARKIIAQVLSPLYQDEVLYFISHRRIDGEKLAAKLADKLKLLTRERNVYRDVVNVAVGDDAQKDIDENLKKSDVLIFLQTKEAQNSKYIMKELCYALVKDIPVLWIQIDGADCKGMEIRPGHAPMLSYSSKDFMDEDRLTEIADEVEEKCFHLMMNSSGQVYSYIECLTELKNTNKIEMLQDKSRVLAYAVEYREKTRDFYNSGIQRHYIQCYGRNPKQKDIEIFRENVKKNGLYENKDQLFLLSNHGNRYRDTGDVKIHEENYEDYIMNIQNVSGVKIPKLGKRIIISGAFPDCDEIYKSSLTAAVMIYAKRIIRSGYTLVFGAHPTFQRPIFEIGAFCSDDIKYSIEMHMSRQYIVGYNKEELEENCTLVLADDLQEMRKNMICNSKKAELLICLGGKMKADKSEQGVDIEVELARKMGIPVALVGTVGGRSSEYALEMLVSGNWETLNPWSSQLNESLFYNVNHRLMAERLLNAIQEK